MEPTVPSGRTITRLNISTPLSHRHNLTFTLVDGAIAHSALRHLVKLSHRALTLSSKQGRICITPALIKVCRNEIVSSKTKWESLKTQTLQSKLGLIA